MTAVWARQRASVGKRRIGIYHPVVHRNILLQATKINAAALAQIRLASVTIVAPAAKCPGLDHHTLIDAEGTSINC